MNEGSADDLVNKGKAYHEAGHAVLQHLFRMDLTNVSIQPVSDLIGGVSQAQAEHPVILSLKGAYFNGTPEHDRRTCHRIMIALGGEAAQREFFEESVEDFHAAFDRREVKELIRDWDRLASQAEREEKVDELYECTRQLLTNPLCVGAVEAVARALLAERQLTGTQAKALIRNAITKAKQEAVASGKASPKLECPHCAEYDDE
jgi:hypothetical protein